MTKEIIPLNEKRNRRIILASTSPRRQELIASLRIPFEIMPSEADEDTRMGGRQSELWSHWHYVKRKRFSES